MSVIVYVECPNCGDELECTMDPGEPSHGPTYSCGGYPGSGAGVDDIEECPCFKSELVHVDKLRAAVEAAALEKFRNR